VKHWYVFLPFLIGQLGFDFGGPGTFLGDVLAFIEGEIVAALSFLFNLIVAVANYVIGGINFTFGFFDTLAQDIRKWRFWLWDTLTKIGQWKIIKAIRDALAALRKHVQDLIAWLIKIRKWYDQYFNQFVKPILNAIRHLRQTLQIFRLLGFKWAARLDARLATIENRIVAAYELLRVNLNKAVSWLQLISDPFGLLRRNPVLGAIIRDAPEMKNAIDRATNHTETQKELDASNRANGWFQRDAAAGNAAYYSKRELPPDMDAARAEFVAAHAALPGLDKQGFPTSDNGIQFG
jgi:hypothetical protein